VKAALDKHQTAARRALALDLWLDPVPDPLRAQARRAFVAGDTLGLLILASNEAWLAIVIENAELLKLEGLYEAALLHAWCGTRTNNVEHSLDGLRWLFHEADRARLLALGDPLPEGEYFTLYRGVAGQGAARRVKGLSWTASREQARWFANRFPHLPDPAVYAARVRRVDVYVRLASARDEDEYVCLLPASCRPRRIPISPHAGARHGAAPMDY
jgi:hypothetical protein